MTLTVKELFRLGTDRQTMNLNLNLNTYIGQELMKQQSNNSNPKRHNKLLSMNNFIVLQINKYFLLVRGKIGGKGIAFYNGEKMILQIVDGREALFV